MHVETRVEAQKYAELRAKTDRQLLMLVRRELRTARAATGGGPVVHPNNRARAEAALATVSRLIPRLSGLDAERRAELQAELDGLRNQLEDEDRFQAACAGCCA